MHVVRMNDVPKAPRNGGRWCRTCITFISFPVLRYKGRISLFHPNNQGASYYPKDSVSLHPSYLVWFESLGGHGTVDDVSDLPSGPL